MRVADLLLAVLTLASCTPAAVVVRPARRPIGAGHADAVFARAVHILDEHGYQLSRCDEDLGALETERLEVDATCGSTTCLSRQTVALKVGWRAVRLSVHREFWDASVRSWVPPEDSRSYGAIQLEETTLLAELGAADLESTSRTRAPAADDACRPFAPCPPASCVSLR